MFDASQSCPRVCHSTSRRSCSSERSQELGAWNIKPLSITSHPERSGAPWWVLGGRVAESKDLQYPGGLRAMGAWILGLTASRVRAPTACDAKRRHDIGDLSTPLRAHADPPPLRFAQDDSRVGSGYARVAGAERRLSRARTTGRGSSLVIACSKPCANEAQSHFRSHHRITRRINAAVWSAAS